MNTNYFRRLRHLFHYNPKDWSEEALVHFRRTARIAKYTGVTPYSWNSKKQQLELSQSPFRFAIFVSQFLVYLMYEGFVIFQWISYSLDENSTTKDKGALQYAAVAYSVPIIAQLSMFSNLYNAHTYANRLLHFMRNDFKRLPHDGRKERRFGKLMRMLPFIGLGTFCMNVPTVFRQPESPLFPTSLLPDVARRSKWELIPFALFDSYMYCNRWGVWLLYSGLMLSYIPATQNALNRTRPTGRLSAEGFCRAMRKLELLQGNANALSRWPLLAIESVLVLVIVNGICGSIWIQGAEGAGLLFKAVLSLAFLLKFWSGLGSVFETSSEVLAEWKRRGELPSLWFTKQLRSMRPIRVEVGHYYVDAAITLTLLSIISENTFNVLLAA